MKEKELIKYNNGLLHFSPRVYTGTGRATVKCLTYRKLGKVVAEWPTDKATSLTITIDWEVAKTDEGNLYTRPSTKRIIPFNKIKRNDLDKLIRDSINSLELANKKVMYDDKVRDIGQDFN